MIEQILNEVSRWAIPFLFFLFLLVGWLRRIPVYEAFIQGAAEGFQIAVRIIPYLVAMFVAIKIFRASG
ncbi:MAG: spore maturation protein, partial [Acetomicrobium sp.]